MAEEKHPASVGLFVVLFGIFVFYLLQTAFWWSVASKEAQHTVDKKTATLYLLRDVLHRGGLHNETLLLDSMMARVGEHSRPFMAEDNRTQIAHNTGRTQLWMFPVLGTVAVLLVVCIGYNVHHGHRLSFGHWAGMVFVLLSYIPELLLFLFVVDRFVVVGDFDLLRRGLGFTTR